MVQLVADMWAEVLRYFRISLEEDDYEDIVPKRRTMLSVALTSSALAGPGLDELWRTMTTLEPAAQVLGGTFHSGSQEEYWDIDVSSSEISSRVPRLQSYLRRVLYLSFERFPHEREQLLWQALPVPDEAPFLCPNLKGFTLDLETGVRFFMYNFSPLISPSLTEITLTSWRRKFHEFALSVLLSILKRHNVQPLRLSYEGYAHHHLFEQITQFPSLTSLSIDSLKACDNFSLEESHIASFRNLSRLVVLEMNLQLLPEGSETTFGNWLVSLEALSTLVLDGCWQHISPILSGSFVFNALRSLELRIWSGEGTTTSASLFSSIYAAFPKLRSLAIYTNFEDLLETAITRADVMMLKERMMDRLVLNLYPIALDWMDIIDFLKLWPTLEDFGIFHSRNECIFEAEYILPQMSVHGVRLEQLSLPLRFSSFGSESLTFRPSNCPLQRLEILESYIPTEPERKITLVQNLLVLFPRLDVIEGRSGLLQSILDREIARSY